MRVSVNEETNLVTIETEVKKEVMDKAMKTVAVLKDDKGNDLYALEMTKKAEGAITGCGITCNAEVGGYLAVTMVLPEDQATKDAVKKAMGVNLVKAKAMLPKLAAQLEAEATALDAIFA